MAKEVVVQQQGKFAADAIDEAIRLVEVTRSATIDEPLFTQFSERITVIGRSIMTAGAAYPIVVTAIFTICGAIDDFVTHGFQASVVAKYIGPVFAGSIIGSGFGYIWAGVVCMLVLPCVYFFVRSLQLHGSLIRLSAFTGGLVGFSAVLPAYGILLYGGHQHLQQTLMTTLVGPALTTVLGQIGGAYGSMGPFGRRRVGEKHRTMATPDLANGEPARPSRMQFRIWHLLVVSIWVSLLLTAIRLMGVDFGFALSLIFGWSVYQAATLWLGERLAAWIGPWWQQRKSRST